MIAIVVVVSEASPVFETVSVRADVVCVVRSYPKSNAPGLKVTAGAAAAVPFPESGTLSGLVDALLVTVMAAL